MAVTSTPRFGLPQWSEDTDPVTRYEFDDAFAAIDAQVANIPSDFSGDPTVDAFQIIDVDGEQVLQFSDGTDWYDAKGVIGPMGSGTGVEYIEETDGLDHVGELAPAPTGDALMLIMVSAHSLGNYVLYYALPSLGLDTWRLLAPDTRVQDTQPTDPVTGTLWVLENP